MTSLPETKGGLTSDGSVDCDAPLPGFILLQQLYAGQESVVYLARQRFLNRLVVLKTINGSTDAANGTVTRDSARLHHEAEIVASLQHPNIVQLHETIETSSGFWCVYEFVDGGSLKGRSADGSVPPELAASWIYTIAGAVHSIHSQGMVHCDLKPENILLTKDQIPKLTDFGVAQRIGRVTVDANPNPAGTPRYMAPEQIMGSANAIGPGVDIHALGAILYELIVGRAPFMAATINETLQQICNDAPLSPRTLQPTIPTDLETICLKCLSKPVTARYPSAQALAEDLDRFLRRQPILARRIGCWGKAALWRRRNPTIFRMAFAGCVMLFILMILFTVQYRATVSALRRSVDLQHQRSVDLVTTLQNVQPESLSIVLDAIDRHHSSVHPLIKELVEDARLTENQRTRLQLALAIREEPFVAPLIERLWSAEPNEFEMIVSILNQRSPTWARELNQFSSLQEATEALPVEGIQAGFRLRWTAARATAGIEVPLSDTDLRSLTVELLDTNAIHMPVWIRLLHPIRLQLAPLLAEMCADPQRSALHRRNAAGLLANVSRDQPELLADTILRVDSGEFMLLFDALQTTKTQAAQRMRRRLANAAPPEVWLDRESHWRQLANAAFVLLRLGDFDDHWSLFQHSSDPSLRSMLIEGCHEIGVDVHVLIDRFGVESDTSCRRALLLAIGNYDPDKMFGDTRKRWLEEVVGLHATDPDAGIHSACEWYLKKWSKTRLELINAPLEQALADQRDWFINSQQQTFTVIRGPTDALMGSPDDEPGREPIEVMHTVLIDRTYAIAVYELTIDQYQRCDPSGGVSVATATSRDYPAGNMNYFDAAKYCRWLSEQEGIPEDQMCYPPADQIKEGMTPVSNYLSRTGYRLPSEAELEWAGRAGARTAFSCGDPEYLLKEYGWHIHNSQGRPWPPGLLKPNDFGLFDHHGNFLEWCQEWIVHSSAEQNTLRSVDVEDLSTVINPGHYRVGRSGYYLFFPELCRCACRNKSPVLQKSSFGIRLARTLVH